MGKSRHTIPQLAPVARHMGDTLRDMSQAECTAECSHQRDRSWHTRSRAEPPLRALFKLQNHEHVMGAVIFHPSVRGSWLCSQRLTEMFSTRRTSCPSQGPSVGPPWMWWNSWPRCSSTASTPRRNAHFPATRFSSEARAGLEASFTADFRIYVRSPLLRGTVVAVDGIQVHSKPRTMSDKYPHVPKIGVRLLCSTC